MKAIDQPFTKIINGTSQFVIPVFQRDYTWTEIQCAQLWNDVLHIAEDDTDRRHFLGSLVYISTGDSAAGFTRWLLIDGQQRMATLTLLLTALRDHIHENNWSGNDKEGDPTSRKIEAYFLKNPEEEGGRSYKLVLRGHDDATLKALIDKEELQANPSTRILECYEFFRDQISDADPAAIYKGIGRLVVVDVTLDRTSDDPQLIFESLNSTGDALSQSDLIRNFILMRLPEKEQTRLYESYWSKIETLFRDSDSTFDAFIRDYMALKTQAKKQEKADEIYQGFRRFFKDLTSNSDNLDEPLEDMLRFARYHAAFSLSKNPPPTIAAPLAHVRRLVDVPAILIMKLFDCFDHIKSLSESDFEEAVGIIESYVFRRVICGHQTRGYWQEFANLAYKIGEDKPLIDLKVGLVRQRENYRFPSDEEFLHTLKERDLYALRTCKVLLERLENYDTNEPTDTSEYSVEHVMPQNETLIPAWREMLGEDWKGTQQTWLHRLGNLTLTGYNSTYSDRSFDEKKSIAGGFEESAVRLNKFIREQEKWTPVEMEQRGSELAQKSLQVWPPLVVEQALIEAAKQQELRETAARRDVDEVKMSTKAKELFEGLRRRVKALDNNILELAESKSVSYHGMAFFLEVLPRKHSLTLLLPLDFNEVGDPKEIAEDASQWKFFFYAKYEGGVAIVINDDEDITSALPIIRQAFEASCM